MMIRTFHAYRRLIGALLVAILVGLPFLRVGGESALRFDVPTLRLLFFGTAISMQDFFIVLIAVIFLTFFILFATTVFGRVWCGWLCPQTVLMDFTGFMENTGRRSYPARAGVFATMLLASAVISASFIGYFVSPYDIPRLLGTGGASARIVAWSWAVLTALAALDAVLLRRKFCASVCPYAKMQSVLFDDRTLVIAFDRARADECRECLACVRACPVSIDIREGLQSACIHCAECVDACARQMSNQDRRPLIRYMFGLGTKRSGIRINPLLIGCLAAVSFVFLMYLAFSRTAFDMQVRLNYTGDPSFQADGTVRSEYVITLRNSSSVDLIFDLRASSPAGPVFVSPAVLKLDRNTDSAAEPVLITLRPAARPGQHSVIVTLTLHARQLGKSIARPVYFMLPPDHKGST